MFVIAGVSGHVGGVAAQELLNKKQKVKVLVRDAKKGAAWSQKGAEVAVADLGDQAALTTALRGAAGFFTLLPPNYAASDFYAYQRQTADAIAGAVRAAGVPHVVQLSSVGADLSAGNGPIKGLNYLENALRATGAKLTSLRASFFQENVGNVLQPARQAGIYPSFFASSDYPVPMVATRDIGVEAAKALQAPPAKSENIDLLGPEYTVRQVAEKLGGALGKTLNIVEVPPANHVGALVQAGFSPGLAEIFAEMYAGFATGRIQPKGDRVVKGTTPIDDTLKTLTA